MISAELMELNAIVWMTSFTPIFSFLAWAEITPMLATATAFDTDSLVLAGVLLSLVVIYLTQYIAGK
jgi:hypothetical protein